MISPSAKMNDLKIRTATKDINVSPKHSFLSDVGLGNHFMRWFLVYDRKVFVLVMNISSLIKESQHDGVCR